MAVPAVLRGPDAFAAPNPVSPQGRTPPSWALLRLCKGSTQARGSQTGPRAHLEEPLALLSCSRVPGAPSRTLLLNQHVTNTAVLCFVSNEVCRVS